MRWLLRDGPRQFVLSTGRGAPFEGAEMIDDAAEAASCLRELSYDPENMRTLRDVHLALIDSANERSRGDALLLAELMSQVAARRLYVFEQRRVMSFSPQAPQAAEEEVWEDAAALQTSEPPPPAPEPAPTAAVIAQARALREAAQSGAPFCEE